MNTISDEDLVTFGRYDDAYAASIVKGVLDTNGIPCMLSNQAMATIFPMTGSSINDVRILVFRKDLNRAREILRDNSAGDSEEDTMG